MNPRHLIISFYLALFIGLTVAGGLYFIDTREEYNRLRAVEARNRLRLEEAEKELGREQKILERLRTDPAYVESVIRRKLGYAKPDEAIFRFEE